MVISVENEHFWLGKEQNSIWNSEIQEDSFLHNIFPHLDNRLYLLPLHFIK